MVSGSQKNEGPFTKRLDVCLVFCFFFFFLASSFLRRDQQGDHTVLHLGGYLAGVPGSQVAQCLLLEWPVGGPGDDVLQARRQQRKPLADGVPPFVVDLQSPLDLSHTALQRTSQCLSSDLLILFWA